MNVAWALKEIEKFIIQTTLKPSGDGHGQVLGAGSDVIEGQSYVVEQILDSAIPGWRSLSASTPSRKSSELRRRE